MASKVNPVTGLTDRQQLFLHEYVKDPANRAAAARRAGYKHPEVAAAKLLDGVRHPAVALAAAKAMEAKARQAAIDAAEIVRGLADIARFNIQDVLDEEGRPIPLHELPRNVSAAISEYEVSHRMGVGTDGKALKVRAVKIKPYSKLEAYKQLAMHLGVFNEWAERMEKMSGTVNNVTNNTVVNMNWAQLTVKDVPEDPRFGGKQVVQIPPPDRDEPPLHREYDDEE